ncbi:MAG: putative lipid II flippase FtsW [Syntrophobacteraceae bacterium CG23_combo_of_CG06-09_8_20_14_all_50_8]|nr:MAG: putative lipid II flippase FtsW [Syntrophobacteraceae bacterium CG23_combo_of_CG06-09_8_20_14_all_50_8]
MRTLASNQKRPDAILLLTTLFLLTAGITMIYSSSSIMALERYKDGLYFLKRQFFYILLGLTGMMLFWKVPYQNLRKWAYPALFLSVALLLLIFVPHMGVKVNKATRWLKIGIFTFQVTELVKITIVIFLAHYLARKDIQPQKFTRGFLIPILITLFVLALILLQPDFGAVVIVAIIMMSLLFLSGVRFRYLAGLIALLVPLAVWQVMRADYRWERLKTLFDPWKDPLGTGFQIIQSFISFGSGGTFGVGIGDGMQKLYYLPEPHTDFILSVIAEEGGFIAVAIIISLFVVFIFRGFIIAYKAPDLFGSLLAAGLTMVIAVEAFVNIAGVMGVVPIKGLALPFVSYGGSSVVTRLTAVGILMNISSFG